ncbi:MAG: aminotransferase class I/II-fold pyridoxal phosphate-dependent enzyme, partial [Myxococcota bacterium]
PALGLDALRERIARWYGDRYGVRVGPERVAVTTGGSGALLLACAVAVEPGSEVLVPDPTYACDRPFVLAMDGRPVPIPVDGSTGWHPTAAQIAAAWTPRTAAAMLTSPSNPTGTVIDPAALRAVAGAVRSRGGTLIVDEVYQELVYDTAPTTALAAGDDVVVVGSFSKFWSMTGWRLGWLVGPEPFVDAVGRLAPHLYVCPPAIAQVAALEAFGPETLAICEGYRRRFHQQRDYLVPALRRLGFGVAGEPSGAFHLYADCSAFTDDALAFCGALLEGAGVAMTPGCDFGDHQAALHVRVSYPKPIEVLAEGIARLERHLIRR